MEAPRRSDVTKRVLRVMDIMTGDAVHVVALMHTARPLHTDVLVMAAETNITTKFAEFV